LFITIITLAEAWQGFHSLQPNHPDHGNIKAFVTELPRQYRVLNFDSRAAAVWGRIAAQATGPLPLRDSLIAAIALSRGFRVVTRDTGPFHRVGCKVLSPWT
jgi:predicted nucleic acid-binding protein